MMMKYMFRFSSCQELIGMRRVLLDNRRDRFPVGVFCLLCLVCPPFSIVSLALRLQFHISDI